MAKNKKKKETKTDMIPISSKFTLNKQSNKAKKTTSKEEKKKILENNIKFEKDMINNNKFYDNKEQNMSYGSNHYKQALESDKKELNKLNKSIKKDKKTTKTVDKNIAPVSLQQDDRFTIKTPEVVKTKEQEEAYQKRKSQATLNGQYIGKKAVSGATTGLTGIVDAPIQNFQEGVEQGKGSSAAKNIIKGYVKSVDYLGLTNIPENVKELSRIATNDKLKTGQKIVKSGLAILNNNPVTQMIEGAGRLFKGLDKNAEKHVEKARKVVEKPSENVSEWAEKDADKVDNWAKTVGGGVEVTTNMLPSIAASIITQNPNVGLATMGISAKGTSTREAEKKGATLSEANDIGFAKGAIEVLTEKMFSGFGKVFGKGALDDVAKEGLNKIIKNKGANYVAKRGMDILGEWFEETVSDLVDTYIDKNTTDPDATYTFKDWLETGKMTALSTIMLNGITGGYMPSTVIENNTELEKASQSENVQKIIEKELEERLNAEYNGKATAREIAQLQKEVIEDIQKGYISTDTIEKTLGGETYNKLDSINQEKNKIQEQIDELQKKADNNELSSLEEKQKLNDLKEQIKAIDDTEIRNQLNQEIQETIKNDIGLQESYNETNRRSENYTVDLNTIEDEKQRAVYQKAMESGVLNNSNKTHALVDMIAKISSEKGINFDFTNNEQLEKSGFGVNGRNINGYVTDSGITINLNSSKAINRIVGHELTHTFEGTKFYTELQDSLKDFLGNEWAKQVAKYEELYKGVKNANVENELTSDLIGDYLFTDESFVRSLSTEHRNLFEKIYDEIKYLYRVATAGSKERRMLEKVKRTFDRIYNETSSEVESKDTKYSLIGEKGVENLKDTQNETYNKLINSLDYAKELDSQNVGNDEIWNKTGWFKDKNGKWKFDLSDKNMSLKSDIKIEKNGEYKLNDIVEHPDLFTVYPELKDVTVRFKDLSSDLKTGSFSNKFNTITINNNRVGNQQLIEETLIHEIQHKIQRIEGFETGTTSKAGRINYYNTLGEIEAADTTNRFREEKYEGKNLDDVAPLSSDKNAKHPDLDIYLKNRGIIDKIKDKIYSGVESNDKTNQKNNQENSTRDRYMVDGRVREVGNTSFSLSKDSNGNTLSENQQNFFKGSKAVDENGNLQVYYNGGGNYTTFDNTKMSDQSKWGKGIYLTEDSNIARMYGDNVKEVYADIKNPINQTEKTISFDTYNKLIQELYDEEADRYDYDMYDNDLDLLWDATNKGSWADYGEQLRNIVGVDGLIIDDSNPAERMAIAFNSNQVKNVSNENPTSNADIRFSITKDSKGKNLSEAQQEYFKDSKAVDDDGNLEIVYHGSKRAGFTTFNTKDNVSFYTNDEGVANTYSGSSEKVDTRKLESIYDAKSWLKGINEDLYIENNKVYDYDGEEILSFDNQEDLLKYLKRAIQIELGNTEAGGVYEGYVNITNPYIVDAKGKNWNDITIGENQKVRDMYESLTKYEKNSLSTLADKMDNMYSDYKEGLEGFYQRLNAENSDLYDKVTNDNSIREKFYRAALYEWNESNVDDLLGKRYSTNDIVNQVLEMNKNGSNYDGVIFTNIIDEGMFDGSNGNTSSVYVTFNPNQFKAADNTNPTVDSDIRYSLSMDSQGRELSEGQQEYFRDSKVRDENGNLETVYHQTKNDFTEFKNGFSVRGFKNANFFTNQKPKQILKNLMEGYVKIDNPLYLENTSIQQNIVDDAIANGYDGIINQNVQGIKGKNEIVTFDSNQFKNIDNLNPTDNPDIRYSLDIAPISKNFLTESEQNELDGLRAVDNSGFAELTPEEQSRMYELENRANTVLDKKAEKMLRSASYKAINTSTKVAENYLDFDANQKKSFRNQMREFSNMTKDELVGADTYNKVKDIVSQYANREYTYFDDSVEGIKRELKHTKIRVTDEMKNQITDYGYFVRDSKLMLRRNSGTPVDQVYQEYSEMYPNFFDADVWSEADQLERLNDFMNHDFSVTEKYKLTDEDLRNATDLIYNKLLDNSLSQQDLITTEEVLDKKVQKRTRSVVREELLDKMGITPEIIQEGNDISAISFARTDPIRVNEKVFGWKTGQLINDATVNFTKHQEAERIRFLNQERQEIKDLGIKARSKESELVQKYGEKQYVDKNNEVHPYTDADLARDVPDIATRNKIKNAARVIRQKYDSYIDRLNSVMTEMGYDEIPKRKDYMMHFIELDDKFSRWGLPFNKETMSSEDLPTDINGLTEFNRPGRSYFASAKERTGLQTTYDAITGIDKYLESASNWIYHTESIQRYRALTRFIRENYGREHGLDNIDLMTDEELADRIKDIQDNKLSKYVAWLDEQANSIAGKKGALDRNVERLFGRRVYTALNTLKSQVGSNMTGFNIRSAMTNFASAIQGMSKTQKLAFVKGTVSTIRNIINNDGLIDKSDFLTRRFGSDSLAMKPWQKLSKAGQIFMEGTDYFTSNQIWRSKYYENLSKGMSEQQAIKNADDFAARIMGDRSKGSTAELFNSKTLGFLSQFQLEVNNQWSSLVHDNKMDIQSGNKTALGVTFELGQLFAASYLFNTMMKELTGSDVMIDPIDMLLKIFKPDDDKDEGIVKRAQKVLGEFINQLPFANLVTGGGRIPISEAFTGAKTLGNKLIGGTDNYGNEISWGDVKEDALESLAYWVLPTGYGQIRKTTKGLSMYDDKLPIAGSYTDSGNLRFSAEDTAYGKVKAALFGQYSSRYAQDYIDSGYKSINASKLDEMKDLDMNSTEYRDYREGLSAAGTSIEDKLNYISDLDVSDEDKTIMASNVAKKDIDMAEYKKFGSYDEFNYAQKNPTKYEVMKLVGGYDTYKNYEKAISEITADYDRNGKAITNSRKNKVIKYVNSLNLTRAQKAMLIKEQYPSFTQYDNEIASYVNNQNMSFIQKAGILKQLGFKAYDRQIINYIRENYRTVEEQQEELEKLGFKIYNYNGKTYVR